MLRRQQIRGSIYPVYEPRACEFRRNLNGRFATCKTTLLGSLGPTKSTKTGYRIIVEQLPNRLPPPAASVETDTDGRVANDGIGRVLQHAGDRGSAMQNCDWIPLASEGSYEVTACASTSEILSYSIRGKPRTRWRRPGLCQPSMKPKTAVRAPALGKNRSTRLRAVRRREALEPYRRHVPMLAGSPSGGSRCSPVQGGTIGATRRQRRLSLEQNVSRIRHENGRDHEPLPGRGGRRDQALEGDLARPVVSHILCQLPHLRLQSLIEIRLRIPVSRQEIRLDERDRGFQQVLAQACSRRLR